MIPPTTTYDYQAPLVELCTALLTDSKPQPSNGLPERRELGDEGMRELRSALVGSHSRQLAFQRSLSAIRAARNLPQDWDSEGGAPAAEAPAEFAQQLVRSLQSSYQVPAPQVCPLSGGVYLEWRVDATELYFEAENDSVLFAMRRRGHLLLRDEDRAFDVQHARRLVESMYDEEEAFAFPQR